MPSLSSVLVDFGTVVGFFRPFFQLGYLDLPVSSCHLTIHVPCSNSPVSSVFYDEAISTKQDINQAHDVEDINQAREQVNIGPITRSRAKKLQQEVNALLCEIHFNISENYILPKSCILLLLRFTKEDDKDTPRLNQRGELRRTSSAWQNCHEETVISLDS